MKRIISILLIALMIFAFVSCNSETAKDTSSPSAKESAEVKENTDAEAKDYVNEKFGFALTLPEGWHFMTKDEIAQNFHIEADMIGAGLDKLTDEKASIIDTVAIDAKGNNVSVAIQKNPFAEDDDIEAKLTESLATAKQALETSGFTVNKVDVGSVKFAGVTYPCSELVSTSHQGRKSDQKQIVIIQDGYCVYVSASALDGADPQGILDMFTELK